MSFEMCVCVCVMPKSPNCIHFVYTPSFEDLFLVGAASLYHGTQQGFFTQPIFFITSLPPLLLSPSRYLFFILPGLPRIPQHPLFPRTALTCTPSSYGGISERAVIDSLNSRQAASYSHFKVVFI